MNYNNQLNFLDLVSLGSAAIYLKKKEYKEQSWCHQPDDTFNFCGLKNIFTGKGDRQCFTPLRFLVIQLV